MKPGKKQTPASAYAVLAIFLIGGLLAAYAEWNEVWWASNEFKPGPAIALELSNLRLGSGMNGQSVLGTLSNGTGKAYKDVQVEVSLFDADGKLLGTEVAFKEVYDVDESWDFAITVVIGTASTVELKDVTGFSSED